MEIKEINIDKIKRDKDQPRKTFDDDSLKHLAESILGNGLITPIDIDENYIIIDGERRYKAHNIAKLKKIPCRIIKLKKDKVSRLKRQLIADLQDEEIPTEERYEAIVKLYKMEKNMDHDLTKKQFSNDLGINPTLLDYAFEYYDFKQEEPELTKEVAPHIIVETRGLPKEERKEVLEEFKGTKDKKKDLIREMVKDKKEILELQKKRKEAEENLSKNQIKIKRTEETLSDLRQQIDYETHRIGKIYGMVKGIRRTKLYVQKPKAKEEFFKFLDGTIVKVNNWGDSLKTIRDNLELEVLAE